MGGDKKKDDNQGPIFGGDKMGEVVKKENSDKEKTAEAEKRSIFATEEGSSGVAVATGQTNKKRTLFGN